VTFADFCYPVWPFGLILSVHDKGYFKTASCALNLISTFLLH